MANPTVTSACHRCRKQKVRCSRDVPACLRCQKANADCRYPPPSNKSPNPELVLAPLQAIDTDPIESLPAVLDNLLQRIFFHYVFTLNLMLHRRTFDAVESPQHPVPFHLRAAMYALTSNFLDPPCQVALPLLEEIQRLGDTKLFGLKWAECAARTCLQRMARPDVYDVQTAAILALYWSARGDQTRNTMFQEMAYRASRTFFLQENSTSHEAEGWLVQEIKHRAFWTSYLQTSVNSDQYVVGSSMDTLLPKVPLPSTQTSFLRRIREMRITIAEVEAMAVNGESSQFEPNVFAELLRLVLHWSKIRDHVETRSRSLGLTALSESARLEKWLSNYHGSINKSIRFDLHHSNKDIDEERLLEIYAVQISYNSCRLQLHASLVAQYNRQGSQEIPQETLQSNALATIEAAQSMSLIAEDILTRNIEAARLSPFMAYSMYVAALIHISFLSLPGDRGHRAWHDFVVLLKVIRSMMQYWIPIQGLWYQILKHFDSQISSHGRDRSLVLPAAGVANDSSVAMRQLRQFGGSLAETVLNYRIRQNEGDQAIDYSSPAMTHLEGLMSGTLPASPAVLTNNDTPIVSGGSETQPSMFDVENLQSYTNLPSELDILASLPSELFFDNDFWPSIESDPSTNYPVI